MTFWQPTRPVWRTNGKSAGGCNCAGAITHDNQTEGYYIVSGGGFAVGSRKVKLKVGDVLIVPPGVIHGWADIPDHVDYLSFRPSHGVMKNGWVNPTIASK